MYHKLLINFFCVTTNILLINTVRNNCAQRLNSRSDLLYVIKLKSTANKHLYKTDFKNVQLNILK